MGNWKILKSPCIRCKKATLKFESPECCFDCIKNPDQLEVLCEHNHGKNREWTCPPDCQQLFTYCQLDGDMNGFGYYMDGCDDVEETDEFMEYLQSLKNLKNHKLPEYLKEKNCELWELRRPDQLPNQKVCYHWWDGKCHTMGCIFNDWDDDIDEEDE
jgi:hypothetical protein